MKHGRAALLLFLFACQRATAPPAQEKQIDYERDNLLNLTHGASVVFRSAELDLENSAVHAIDSDSETYWQSSPGGAAQTLVFSFPARTRIERLGILSSKLPEHVPAQVRFAASDDATNWREVATVDLQPSEEPQIVNVTPFDATYLRVDTIESGDQYSFLRSLFAYGREIAPPVKPAIEGCWTINGVAAKFVKRGTSVTGTIGATSVNGTTDGRVTRLKWTHGPAWGNAIVTLDPQRRTLSGERWHEEKMNSETSGDAWFGVPAPCAR